MGKGSYPRKGGRNRDCRDGVRGRSGRRLLSTSARDPTVNPARGEGSVTYSSLSTRPFTAAQQANYAWLRTRFQTRTFLAVPSLSLSLSSPSFSLFFFIFVFISFSRFFFPRFVASPKKHKVGHFSLLGLPSRSFSHLARLVRVELTLLRKHAATAGLSLHEHGACVVPQARNGLSPLQHAGDEIDNERER